jgi:hypothetical protein
VAQATTEQYLQALERQEPGKQEPGKQERPAC